MIGIMKGHKLTLIFELLCAFPWLGYNATRDDFYSHLFHIGWDPDWVENMDI